MELLFWICTVIIVYVYAGYPALLAVAGATRRAFSPRDPTTWPEVTLIVSAYNEAGVIHEKLANTLALDYPVDRLEILVVSDCSDDGTDALVEAVDDPRVRLVRLQQRSGKSAGLNAAVAQARGEILVFTDANAMFDRDALRHLVRPFSAPGVGVVTGEQRYRPGGGDAGDREGAYWRYELMLKRLESRAGSLVGGDGAIMALRKVLYTPLEPSDLSDFLLPLRAVAAGYTNVYEPRARCYEDATGDAAKELARKVRIVNRAWRATMKCKPLLNPLLHGWFAIALLSHKVLRWLAGVFMMGALIGNLALAPGSWFYAATLATQLAFYGAAALAWRAPEATAARWMTLPYYFCLVNYASLKGILENYLGETYTTWSTARQPGARQQ